MVEELASGAQARFTAAAERVLSEPALLAHGLGAERARELEAELPAVLAAAERALVPGGEGSILDALQLLSEGIGIPLPGPDVLDLMVEVMARWPADLFRAAFLAVFESWRWRRFPAAGDFRRVIEGELAVRGDRLALLRRLEKRLRLQRRWTAPARPPSSG